MLTGRRLCTDSDTTLERSSQAFIPSPLNGIPPPQDTKSHAGTSKMRPLGLQMPKPCDALADKRTPSASRSAQKYLQTPFQATLRLKQSNPTGTEIILASGKQAAIELDDLILDEPILNQVDCAHWHRRSGGAWWRFDRTTTSTDAPETIQMRSSWCHPRISGFS